MNLRKSSKPTAPLLDQDRVSVFVTGSTTTQEPQRLTSRICDLVDGSRRNRNRVSRTNRLLQGINPHERGAGQNVIDFLSLAMKVGSRRGSRGKPGLGQALIGDARVAMGQELPNLRAIFGRERQGVIECANIHLTIALLEAKYS